MCGGRGSGIGIRSMTRKLGKGYILCCALEEASNPIQGAKIWSLWKRKRKRCIKDYDLMSDSIMLNLHSYYDLRWITSAWCSPPRASASDFPEPPVRAWTLLAGLLHHAQLPTVPRTLPPPVALARGSRCWRRRVSPQRRPGASASPWTMKTRTRKYVSAAQFQHNKQAHTTWRQSFFFSVFSR